MAIKISGNTVIDDSQNITATGSATIDGPISLGSVALPSAGTARIYSRDTDNSLYLQTSSGNRISLLDGSQNSMASFEPTTLKFFISNTPVMRIDSSGNMGLGTESPSSLLHVSGQDATINVSAADGSLSAMTSNTSQRIAFQGGNTEIGLFKDSSDNYSYVIGTYQGSIDIPLVFRTGNRAERMRIDSSGRLLQGKTSSKGSTGANIPTYCTEIASNNPNVLEIANNGTHVNSYSALVLSRSDSSSVNGHTAIDSNDKIGEVCFIGADGSDRFNTGATIAAIAQADFTANNCPTHLTFSTNSGSAVASERMRIDSSGQVYIGGTSDLLGKLSVRTAGTTDTSLHLATTGGSSNNGQATNSIRFTGGTNSRWANAKYEAFDHIFHGNGVEQLRIDYTGNATLAGTITANGGYALSQLTELT